MAVGERGQQCVSKQVGLDPPPGQFSTQQHSKLIADCSSFLVVVDRARQQALHWGLAPSPTSLAHFKSHTMEQVAC